jgi:HPt (histidine-containing phosphotransfer) domain-containing protein
MSDMGIIDWKQLALIREECGPEEAASILAELISELPPLFTGLRTAHAAFDAAETVRLAHQIKGSCATFGLARFAEHLHQIEGAAQAGQLPSPADLDALESLAAESLRRIAAGA